jgi:hypothetical protein
MAKNLLNYAKIDEGNNIFFRIKNQKLVKVDIQKDRFLRKDDINISSQDLKKRTLLTINF